ncbi:tRNA glutamyl-Q(34) synthetase GluQRS [Kiritimatiellaeota bacterium B1221]|nr:tRNA glutamyl-Q(34) synthetase GluQRS [Kiritimatiellaeota bacterium B1221]
MNPSSYIGRLAPTPTGELHLGHARTFYQAWKRARDAGGSLFMRLEDLDTGRCKPAYAEQALDDLKWLGLDWDGEVIFQSQHPQRYLDVWRRLKEGGWIYPCSKSRKDLRSLPLPDTSDEQDAEAIFPIEWRPEPGAEKAFDTPEGVTWRFRIPEGEAITFSDVRKGEVSYTAGKDFGDFSIWRRDNIPAYELSVVVDDIHQNISEVVRGEDLLRSTARQLLLYRALNAPPPAWCHEPLVRDAKGVRLAKRFHSLSIHELRASGKTPQEVLQIADMH